jgi:hypothetical protein
VVTCPGHFTPGKEPPVSLRYNSGWAPEPVWTLWNREKSLAPVGNLILPIQPVACHYTDSAIPGFLHQGLEEEFKENKTAFENVFQDAARYLTLLIPTLVLAFAVRW